MRKVAGVCNCRKPLWNTPRTDLRQWGGDLIAKLQRDKNCVRCKGRIQAARELVTR